ncbi:MAG: alpha-amylase family glycosyl hydrolase [Gemmatimonadota bacterium]
MRRIRTALTATLLPVLLAGCGDPSEPGDGNGTEPPDTVEDGYTFTYEPPAGAPTINSISLAGSFNDWTGAPMVYESGVWERVVELDSISHQYKFIINDDWIVDMCYDETWGDPGASYRVDPDADGCVSDGYEGRNAVITLGDVPLEFRHVPDQAVWTSVADGRLSVRFRARSDRVVDAVAIAGDTVPMHPQLDLGLYRIWRASLPGDAGEYAIEVETPDSVARFGPFAPPAEPFASVPWVEDAVGYQIFPERFWNGDPSNDSLALETDEIHYLDPALQGTDPVLSDWDGPVLESHCCHQYFGGDLQGIIDRLDHLEGLGVSVVYLNPIFLAGSAHGYDTYDYREVAPNFGDSTVLRSLVDAAHARGIRLIWDFVPNHVGIGHWAFRDALANGEASDYWDWFEFHVPADSVQAGNGNHYEAWWGIGSLPELQTVNTEVMDHLMDIAREWTEYGFDGIRVDVPGEIENRTVFFSTFRETAKAVDPEVYLVGEIWERDPSWLRGDQFDALMSYALGQGIVARFAGGEISGIRAAGQLATLFAEYPEAAAAMSFNLIASHDTDRVLTMMGGGELGDTPPATALARQRLAAALLFAMPGMPVTYQGDECAFLGGSGGRHTARYPIQWDACDPDMSAHYTELGELKRTVPALATAVFRSHDATGTLLSFYRGEPGPGELLAVFNRGGSPEPFDLPAGSWTDAVTGATESDAVTVDGHGWRYLVRD